MSLVHLEHVEFDLILAQVDSLSCLTTVEVVGDNQKSEILGEKSSFQPTLHRHKVVRLSSHVVDLSLQLRLPEVKIFETLPETFHRLFLYTPNNTAAVPFFFKSFLSTFILHISTLLYGAESWPLSVAQMKTTRSSSPYVPVETVGDYMEG